MSNDIDFNEINKELQGDNQTSENQGQSGSNINLTFDQLQQLLKLNQTQSNTQSQPQQESSGSQDSQQQTKKKKEMSERKRLAVEKMKEGRRKQLERQRLEKEKRKQQQGSQAVSDSSGYQPYLSQEVDVSNPPYVPPSHNPQMTYVPPQNLYQNYQHQYPVVQPPPGQVYDYSQPQYHPQYQSQPQPVQEPPQPHQRIPKVNRYNNTNSGDVLSQLGFRTEKPTPKNKSKKPQQTPSNPQVDPFEHFR